MSLDNDNLELMEAAQIHSDEWEIILTPPVGGARMCKSGRRGGSYYRGGCGGSLCRAPPLPRSRWSDAVCPRSYWPRPRRRTCGPHRPAAGEEGWLPLAAPRRRLGGAGGREEGTMASIYQGGMLGYVRLPGMLGWACFFTGPFFIRDIFPFLWQDSRL